MTEDNNVVRHPSADAAEEVEIRNTPEALDLQWAIHKAMQEYWDYLDRNGLIYPEGWEDDGKYPALIAWTDPCEDHLFLEHGAEDRVMPWQEWLKKNYRTSEPQSDGAKISSIAAHRLAAELESEAARLASERKL
jgi:hypothetical protein